MLTEEQLEIKLYLIKNYHKNYTKQLLKNLKENVRNFKKTVNLLLKP